MAVVLTSPGRFANYTAAYEAIGPTAISNAVGRSNRWAVLVFKGRMLPSLAIAFALEEHVGIPVASWRELARDRRKRRGE